MEIHRMVPAGLSYKGSMRQNLIKIPLYRSLRSSVFQTSIITRMAAGLWQPVVSAEHRAYLPPVNYCLSDFGPFQAQAVM
jgi:hypothetical protein